MSFVSKAIRVKNVPEGAAELKDFEIVEEKIDKDAVKDNEVLIQIQYVSVDPYLRGRMQAFHNKVVENFAIAKVLVSKDKNYKENDIVTGVFPWRQYSILNGSAPNIATKDLIAKHKEIPLPYWVGILGMPGMTAYYGLLEIGKCKEGENILISGAAGAVGMIVGQIAKKIKKCNVVGLAGGDKKCKFLKEELGFDHAIDYQKFNNDPKLLQEELKKVFPNGIDIYFDNTGGFITESVWDLLNRHARVPICGQIANYNQRNVPPKIGDFLMKLIYKNIRVEGFIVFDFTNYQEFYADMIKWIKEGLLISRETILKGFDNIPQGFLGLFTGANTGKMVIDCTEDYTNKGEEQ